MPNPLALFALAAGAFLILGRKKGEAAAPDTSMLPTLAPNPETKTTSSWEKTWMKRQQSLVDVGIDIGDYGPNGDGVDGKPGPVTRSGIAEFQGKAGIPVDGKWGPITDAAMVKALARLAQGFTNVVSTVIGSQIKTAMGITEWVEGWWSGGSTPPATTPPPSGFYTPGTFEQESGIDSKGRPYLFTVGQRSADGVWAWSLEWDGIIAEEGEGASVSAGRERASDALIFGQFSGSQPTMDGSFRKLSWKDAFTGVRRPEVEKVELTLFGKPWVVYWRAQERSSNGGKEWQVYKFARPAYGGSGSRYALVDSGEEIDSLAVDHRVKALAQADAGSWGKM
jgi:hypothetical protein